MLRVMRVPCRIWLTLVTLAAAITVAAGAGAPLRAAALNPPGPGITVTDQTIGSTQHAVADLAGLAAGQGRQLSLGIRNGTGGAVTVRLEQVAFPGDGTGVLDRDATVSLSDGATVLGTGGPASSRLIGASTLIPAGTTRQLSVTVSLPASAGRPGARGHSLTAEFAFVSEAGTAPVGTGISTGSGPGLPPTAGTLTVFHGMVWGSLALLAAALVLGTLLAFRRRGGDDAGAGTGAARDVPEGTRG